MANVVSINISEKKGTKKTPVSNANLIQNFGIEGDAHGGFMHRQISLLAEEDIQMMREKGLDTLNNGDFAENITTTGIDLPSLPVGTRFTIGDTIHEVSQIGKECHNKCQIFHKVGGCVMPKRGIFTIVIKGGIIKVGDEIEIL